MATTQRKNAAFVTSRFEGLVRQILHEKGMTLTEASKILGYASTQGLVSLISKGNPQLDSLLYLLKKLDVEPLEFMARLMGKKLPKSIEDEGILLLPYLTSSSFNRAMKKSKNATVYELLLNSAKSYEKVSNTTDRGYAVPSSSYAKEPASPIYGVIPTYPLPKQAFDGAIARDPARHMVAEVATDEMNPVLPKGVTIVAEAVDEADWPTLNNGIYAVQVGSKLLTKRIKDNDLSVTGNLVLESDNPTYGSLTIAKEDIRFVGKIIGTVENIVE